MYSAQCTQRFSYESGGGVHLTGHLTPDSTSASDQSELEHNAVDQRDSVIREKCFSSGHRKIGLNCEPLIFYNDFCILLSHLGKGVTPLIKKSYAARACRIHHHPGYVVSAWGAGPKK